MTEQIPDGEMSEMEFLKAQFFASDAEMAELKAAREAKDKRKDENARRRIARMKQPDLRALAYFVHEMRNEDGVTIKAALRYLIDRFSR